MKRGVPGTGRVDNLLIDRLRLKGKVDFQGYSEANVGNIISHYRITIPGNAGLSKSK